MFFRAARGPKRTISENESSMLSVELYNCLICCIEVLVLPFFPKALPDVSNSGSSSFLTDSVLIFTGERPDTFLKREESVFA